ncbi:MAG: RHS repeat-associated core domain-containing protein [Candidatus Kapaibacterium sp.]
MATRATTILTTELVPDGTNGDYYVRELTQKQDELKDHLGNVRVVISDLKVAPNGSAGPWEADILSWNNYYPFGMVQPDRHGNTEGYRYGFNGKEMDNEVRENPTTGTSGVGNHYDYGFRVYDPRIARFLSVDPLADDYPWYTPYQYAGNKPIKFIDLDGLEEAEPRPTVSGGYFLQPDGSRTGIWGNLVIDEVTTENSQYTNWKVTNAVVNSVHRFHMNRKDGGRLDFVGIFLKVDNEDYSDGAGTGKFEGYMAINEYGDEIMFHDKIALETNGYVNARDMIDLTIAGGGATMAALGVSVSSVSKDMLPVAYLGEGLWAVGVFFETIDVINNPSNPWEWTDLAAAGISRFWPYGTAVAGACLLTKEYFVPAISRKIYDMEHDVYLYNEIQRARSVLTPDGASKTIINSFSNGNSLRWF